MVFHMQVASIHKWVVPFRLWKMIFHIEKRIFRNEVVPFHIWVASIRLWILVFHLRVEVFHL